MKHDSTQSAVGAQLSKVTRLFSTVLAFASGTFFSQSQPVITAGDLFNQVGQYYRAYSNQFDPMDISGGTAYIVPGDLIGSAGPDQFWDFSTGPKEKVLRFDYVSPAGIEAAADFAAAKVAEKKTEELDGSVQWLFFEQVPGQGRKVYGFYADNPLFTPSNVFVPPILDFPDRITYGLEWTTSTTFENDLSINNADPTDPDGVGLFNIRQQTTLSSKFKADAYGTIVLPDSLGAFRQGLRINEEQTIDIAVDLGEGQFQHIETDYTRNYYWLMPGLGIVAQLNSTQNSSLAPDNFSRATAFLRMFETNKKASTGGNCNNPGSVTDLKIRLDGGSILLTWSKAECASQYRVEYTSNPAVAGSWTPLGVPTSNLRWLGENTAADQIRFYRVVSLK